MGFRRPSQSSLLSLNGLKIPVRIGYGEEERKNPQTIRFDVRVRFSTLPKGCTSDDLQDTLCYDEIAQKIRRVSTRQEYRLIERLAWDCYLLLRETMPADSSLGIRVTKEIPPIEGLTEGASFCVGDGPENWS